MNFISTNINNPWIITILGGVLATLIASVIFYVLRAIRMKPDLIIMGNKDSSSMNKMNNNTLKFQQYVSITIVNQSKENISGLKLQKKDSWVNIEEFKPPVFLKPNDQFTAKLSIKSEIDYPFGKSLPNKRPDFKEEMSKSIISIQFSKNNKKRNVKKEIFFN